MQGGGHADPGAVQDPGASWNLGSVTSAAFNSHAFSPRRPQEVFKVEMVEFKLVLDCMWHDGEIEVFAEEETMDE